MSLFLMVAATVFMVIGFVPLVGRMLRHRSSRGISRTMLMLGFLQSLALGYHDYYFDRQLSMMLFAVLALLFLSSYVIAYVYRR